PTTTRRVAAVAAQADSADDSVCTATSAASPTGHSFKAAPAAQGDADATLRGRPRQSTRPGVDLLALAGAAIAGDGHNDQGLVTFRLDIIAVRPGGVARRDDQQEAPVAGDERR